MTTVKARIRELGITAADLAHRTGVPYGTVRHFGLLSHDRDTLERLPAALDWSPGHLRKLCDDPD
jgi:hypothetical protein